MDMGSRRMQIVGIVLAVLMAAMLAVTLWAYRPVSLAEAADARTGLEPKVVVVVRLDEMDGNGTSHEYQAYDPALLEQMEELAEDTSTVFISHGDCLEEAQGLAQAIREKFPVERLEINFVGPVIGNHSGPGTLALFFLGKHK